MIESFNPERGPEGGPEQERECDECSGRGVKDGKTCPKCNGKGWILKR